MKIVILTPKRNNQNYENVRFLNVARQLGIGLMLVDPANTYVKIDKGRQEIYFNDKLITDCDYLLVRVGCMISSHDQLIISAFLANNTRVSARGEKIYLMAHKMQLSQYLVSHNVDVIDFAVFGNGATVKSDFGFPCVIKSNVGSLGMGIYLAKSSDELTNLVNQARLLDKNYQFQVQRFIDHKVGEDIRVFMYKDKVISAMRRVSLTDDFRANYAVHNNAQAVEVDAQMLEICQKVAKLLDVDIIGIDLLETKSGYVVCEVNSAPGFKGLETCNKDINVAKFLLGAIKNELGA